MSQSELVRFVTAAIRRYLQAHPLAADTLEGVHRWWIDWSDQAESPDATRAALHQLVDDGVMECVEIANRRVWRGRRVA